MEDAIKLHLKNEDLKAIIVLDNWLRTLTPTDAEAIAGYIERNSTHYIVKTIEEIADPEEGLDAPHS